jgi:hypothetical protein
MVGAELPVAQRELAMLYQTRPSSAPMRLLFEQAARGGDTEAAFQLGEMLRACRRHRRQPHRGMPGRPAAARARR